MITTADAIEVMAVVAACHHRTAQRLDDKEAAVATAIIWRDLFNEFRLEMPDLVAAVKKRGAREASAPEPAEIITVARAIRQDRSDRESDKERADREAAIDAKALGEIVRRTGYSVGRSIGEAVNG